MRFIEKSKELYLRLRNNNNHFQEYCDIKSTQVIKAFFEETPVYSFIIPTYKRLETFKQALESVLQQDGINECEIVVVDDYSVSGDANPTYNYLCNSNITRNNHNINYYINNSNLGEAANINRGVELAIGQFVILLHDDDRAECYLLRTHFIRLEALILPITPVMIMF